MPKKLAQIYHFDSFGKRQEKYYRLSDTKFQDVNWKELEPKEPYYFFVPKDFSAEKEYNKGFSVSEIFNINSTGITTSRDKFIIDENKKDLRLRIQDFINLSKDELFEKYQLKDTRDFKIDKVKTEIKEVEEGKFVNIDYRIFDTKNIYYEVKLIDWNRKKVMYNMLQDNLGLICMRQFVENNGFNHIFTSKNLIDNRTFSSSRGLAYFFPLYLYNQNKENLLDEEITEKVPNLDGEIIEKIEKKLGMPFVYSLDDNYSDIKGDYFTPEDLFDYIYAVLHSTSYRETYKEFLKIDFPKVPFNVNKETFFKMVELGRELRSYHLLENEKLIPNNFITKYPITGDNLVEKIKYEDEKVFINDEQYFEGIPKEVFEFYIGGYQPAQKWLKDRKGRELGYEDILHYGKMIISLSETVRIMGEIEGVFKV